jgi:DMSO/TMAO reductase YedYZ heme-binding membrane subunit
MSRTARLEGWTLTFAISAALLAAWIVTLALLGLDEAGWRAVIRNSARTTLALFLLVFPAGALCRRWPTPATRWLLRNRRFFGVSAAVSHGLHFAAILGLYGRTLVEERSPLSLAVGAIPYVLLAAMAFTSSDRAVRALGPRRWRALHTLGLYVLFVAFFAAYLGRTLREPWHLPILLLLAAELALRLWPARREVPLPTTAAAAQ